MPQQLERRARRLVAFYRVLASASVPMSAYAVGKQLGYRPSHAHRWTRPLVECGAVGSSRAGLRSKGGDAVEQARKIAKAAACSLSGKRRATYQHRIEAEIVVGKLLGVRLYDLPMTQI